MASGNGDPAVCAANLLRTVRGEVPMARVKGIGREHIDAPADGSTGLMADAEWVLETFEPRLGSAQVESAAAAAAQGDFALDAIVEEEDDVE